jgi:hypothetical protein
MLSRVLLVRLLLPALLILSVSPALRAELPIEERWYMLQLQGKRAGHVWERTERAPDAWRQWTKMVMSVKRANATIDILIESTVVEKPDGTPVSISSKMAMGAEPTTTTYTFKPDGVEVEVSQKDRVVSKTTESLPEGKWMLPISAADYAAAELAAGKTEMTLRIIDPTTGLKPLTYTRKVIERANIDVLGKTVPAVKWSSTVDAVPGLESVEYVDDQGKIIKNDITIGAMNMEMMECDRQLALAKVDPPELMASTLVAIDEPIKNPREVRDSAFELSLDSGSFPAFPTTSIQSAKAPDRRKYYIRTAMRSPVNAPEDDNKAAKYRAANAMLNFNDPEVRRVQAEASVGMEGVIDSAELAERMRQYVHDYIKSKSLNVGFASASETARIAEGDCSEHAVLLAALLRGAGIPSRVASGLVYVDEFAGHKNVFGYHMWTQALLDTKGRRLWVDLDATIDKRFAFDATHICLETSAMGDGETINSLVTLAPVIGKLKIKVIKAEP